MRRYGEVRAVARRVGATNSHFPNGHVVLVILMAASKIDVMSINVRKWLRFPQFTHKIDEFDLFILQYIPFRILFLHAAKIGQQQSLIQNES